MALILYEPSPILEAFHAPERIFQFSGLQNVTIKQDWNTHGVAAVVWEAAVVLGTYLQNMSSEIHGKNILELGSGTGLSGIIACLLGARVTFTDLNNALSACSSNIELNLDSSIHNYDLKSLDWTENLSDAWSAKHFDFIIGADLIYIEEIFQDLINTILYFTKQNKQLKMFLSGKIRYVERYGKFKKMLENSFHVDEVYFNKDVNVYIWKICFK